MSWISNLTRPTVKKIGISKDIPDNFWDRCPKCGAIHSIKTKNRTVYCEKCDLSLTMDDRYMFNENEYFESFAKWYEWQYEEIVRAIQEDKNYQLTANVELKSPSLDGETLLRTSGQGVCTLNSDGLTYRGTKDGCDFEIQFPLSKVYRLLFGAGEDFEVYYGNEIYYFIPEEKRSCVEWYMTSRILYDSIHSKSQPIKR